MNERKSTNPETFQDGVTPLQEFSGPAIEVVPGMAIVPRLGRPARGSYSDRIDRRFDERPSEPASGS